MDHLIIGLIVGIIMGLTGAGGALIAIPLFLHLTGASLKEATILSLIAVLLGTGINLINKLKNINKKIIFFFVSFGAIASLLSLSLKKLTPDLAIAFMLAALGTYSLWSVWKKKKTNNVYELRTSALRLALIGLLIGVITTLTGLGGGVILIPLLINFIGMTYDEALPHSLLTIFIISSISLILQINTRVDLITLKEISLLAGGVAIALFIQAFILKKLSQSQLEFLRKLVFSFVTIYSITSVFLKSI